MNAILYRLTLLLFGPVVLIAATTNKITKDGITWNFSVPVEFGQFVTGDPFILSPPEGITISAISPAPLPGRNGTMINPSTGTQAYDDRISYYSKDLGLTPPFTALPGSSIVSTVSLQTSDESPDGYIYPTWGSSRISPTHVKLKNASILTVLSSVPPPDAYRPPYIGTNKPLYRTSQIQKNLVPNIPTDPPPRTLTFYERSLARPWLTHIYDFTARELHPSENMPNYHRDVGILLSEVSLLLLSNRSSTTLLNGFIQTGIDQYAMAISGKGDSALFDWQIIYTGLLLDRPDIYNVFVEQRSLTPPRSIEHFYFYTNRLSKIDSKIVPPGKTWTGSDVFFRKGYGDKEHEHLHPTEWAQVDDGGGLKQENYRQCCDSTPHLGMALAAEILNMTQYFPNRALAQYLRRWMNEPFNQTFAVQVRAVYPDFKSTAGTLGSKFADNIWSRYSSNLLVRPTAPKRPKEANTSGQ